MTRRIVLAEPPYYVHRLSSNTLIMLCPVSELIVKVGTNIYALSIEPHAGCKKIENLFFGEATNNVISRLLLAVLAYFFVA